MIAYAVHEHQAGPATRIQVTLQPHSCAVQDDGRGMGLDRKGYVIGLIEQLAARRGEVALHGIGLAILAACSPWVAIESRRSGMVSTQEYSWGIAQGPVRSEPATGPSGTRIAFDLASEAPAIDADLVIEQIEVWRQAHPSLRIDVRIVR